MFQPVSSFRLFLSLVVVALLAVFVGAPFYLTPAPVEAAVSAPTPPPLASEKPAWTPPQRPGQGPFGSRVALVQPVIFPVKNRGGLVGHVRAQAGTTVEFVSENGPEVVVRLVNSSVRVPRTSIAALDPTSEEATPDFVENAKSAGQRIWEYWFPNQTKDLSPAPQ